MRGTAPVEGKMERLKQERGGRRWVLAMFQRAQFRGEAERVVVALTGWASAQGSKARGEWQLRATTARVHKQNHGVG
jgi:hypothetical protein